MRSAGHRVSTAGTGSSSPPASPQPRRKHCGGCAAVPLDVTSETSVSEAAKLVDAEYGRLDVLVNNADVAGAQVPALDVGAEEMREVYETNVFGPVRVMRAFLPLHSVPMIN